VPYGSGYWFLKGSLVYKELVKKEAIKTRLLEGLIYLPLAIMFGDGMLIGSLFPIHHELIKNLAAFIRALHSRAPFC
jgi:hypothetical protein